MTPTKRFTYSVPWFDSDRTDRQRQVTTIIAEGCRLVGMGGIHNELAAKEYFTRAWMATAAGVMDFYELTYSDVADNIGLKCNVTPIARPRFLAQLARFIADRALSEVPHAITNNERLDIAMAEGAGRV